MATRTSTQLACVLLVGWAGLTCTSPNPAYFRGQPPADAGPGADAVAGAGGAGAAPNSNSGGQAGAGQGGTGGGQGNAGSAGSDASDGPGPSSDAALNLDQGLVSRWHFDEFSLDTSALPQFRNGAVRVVDNAPGSPHGSVALDGVDDHVLLPLRGLPRAEEAKSISIWFRSLSTTPRLRALVSLIQLSGSAGMHLGFEDNTVAVWHWESAGPFMNTAAVDDRWHHTVYVYDGTRHDLYLDGAHVATSSYTMLPGAITNALLGTFEVPKQMFKGQLAELRIYNRQLKAAEVAALMATP